MDESALILSASSFLQNANHSGSGNILVQHPSWPAKRASRTTAVAESFVRGRVWCALESLVHRVGLGVENQVEVYVKPRKHVKTTTKFDQGRLMLIPEAATLKIFGKDALSPEHCAPSGLWEVVVEYPPAGFSSRMFLAGGGADAVSAFWYVEIVEKEEEANMQVVWFRVSSLSGSDPVSHDPRGMPAASGSTAPAPAPAAAASGASTDRPDEARATIAFSKATGGAITLTAPALSTPPPKAAAPRASGEGASRKRLASLALVGASDEPFDRVVYIPVFVNKEALAEGAELKVLWAFEKAQPKAAKAISVVQLAKRAKT